MPETPLSLWQKLDQTWPARLARSAFDAVYPDYLREPPLTNMPTEPGKIPQRDFDPVGAGAMGAIDFASLFSGMGATKAAAPLLGLALRRGGPIRAYHGSPYDFDKFDISKIGTGEGAQAYGHGLYFAENPLVAESYKGGIVPTNSIGNTAKRYVDKFNGDYDLAISYAQKRRAVEKGENAVFWSDVIKRITRAKQGGNFGPRGRMYEVNIHASPEQFLDWDKGLSGQTAEVAQRVRSMPNYERAGAPFLEKSDYALGPAYKQGLLPSSFTPEGGSRALKEAGIPGIKYLDQGSRSAGEGSRNYVVFDDSIIEILKKYGIAGLTALVAASSGAPKSEAAPSQ